jgi:hypothetical protein
MPVKEGHVDLQWVAALSDTHFVYLHFASVQGNINVEMDRETGI